MHLPISSCSPFILRKASMKIALPKSAVTMLSLTAALGAIAMSAQAHDYPTTQAQTNAVAPQGIVVTEVNAADKVVMVDGVPAAGQEQGKKEGDGDGNRRGNNPNRNADRAAQNRAQEGERRAMFTSRIREMLTKAGFPEVATQDAIIAYIASEEEAKGALRMATRRLAGSLRREAPPERLKDLLAEYKKANDAEKKRKETARADLDTKISFSKNPRLEAILLISGILGDNNTSRFDMWMQMSRGQGQGGFNGPQRGGQGNQNGNPNGAPDGPPRPYPPASAPAPGGVPQAPTLGAVPETPAQPAAN
jgi:hypothetical protein